MKRQGRKWRQLNHHGRVRNERGTYLSNGVKIEVEDVQNKLRKLSVLWVVGNGWKVSDGGGGDGGGRGRR